MPSLIVEYDNWADVLTVEGIHYSGSIFRNFASGPLNKPFKIIKREDGVLTCVEIENERSE